VNFLSHSGTDRFHFHHGFVSLFSDSPHRFPGGDGGVRFCVVLTHCRLVIMDTAGVVIKGNLDLKIPENGFFRGPVIRSQFLICLHLHHHFMLHKTPLGVMIHHANAKPIS